MGNAVQAEFEERKSCIACGSTALRELASGRFSEDPIRGFITEDPWGENPLPHLENATWSFVQCADCGQRFHGRVLSTEWMRIFYNRWITNEAIKRYRETFGKSLFRINFGRGVHRIENTLRIEKHTRALRGGDAVRVLDFGCGDGGFLAACACCGFDCAGVDISKASIDALKSPGIRVFETLDEVDETFPPGHFHAITLIEVLEHLTAPLDTLHRLRRCLTDGGVLILETPNCRNVADIRTREDYDLIHPLGHINAFTPRTLERIAKAAGFSRVSSGTVQATASMGHAVKREIRRVLTPFLKDNTRQMFRAGPLRPESGRRHQPAGTQT